MQIPVVVGGTPGRDCGGFCKFCYFKGVDYNKLDKISLGCRYCPPDRIGCDHCHEVINDIKNGFRPVSRVLSHLENVLRWHEFLGTLKNDDLKFVTASWADIIYYPQLPQLISTLKDWGSQIHLGYTSGKGIKDEKMAEGLLSMDIDELNFSVFSMDPEMRRKWMGDKTPQESLNALKLFCENIEVNVSVLVIPGVIDEEEIFNTCSILEEWGIKSFMLNRFANFKNQGLILNDQDVIEGITPQPYEEFLELIGRVSDEFSFKVLGTPFNDPEKNVPYAISKKENINYLGRLPPITKDATIITSKLSFKPLKKIFETIARDRVNVVAADKEIGDLITHEDLALLDLNEIKDRVIIPGGALVHDNVVREILNKDGKKRSVVRGPGWLFFYDFEQLSKEDVINYELKAFKTLINKINNSETF